MATVSGEIVIFQRCYVVAAQIQDLGENFIREEAVLFLNNQCSRIGNVLLTLII